MTRGIECGYRYMPRTGSVLLGMHREATLPCNASTLHVMVGMYNLSLDFIAGDRHGWWGIKEVQHCRASL